jgi:hypothetical protein
MASHVCLKPLSNDHSFQRSLLPHIASLNQRPESNDLDLLSCVIEKIEIRFIYYDGRKSNAAEKLLCTMFKFSNKLLGPEHLYMIFCMACVASAVKRQGQVAKAEELHKQAFELSKYVLGPMHPSTLVSMSNIASAVWKQR